MTSYLRQNNFLFFIFICASIGLLSCAGGTYPIKSKDDKLVAFTIPKVQVDKMLYSCQINGSYGIKKYSFSGILLIKQMEDNSTRVVFQNQMGFNFFDFEWTEQGTFKVISIQDKMNNAALIKTLQKDFEVILHHPNIQVAYNPISKFIIGDLAKGKVVYEYQTIDSLTNTYILSEQNKKVVSIKSPQPYGIKTLPSVFDIKHHKANFNIKLQQLITEE